MNKPIAIVKIQGTKKRETNKAILFCVDSVNDKPIEKSKDEWFPRSQIISIHIDPMDAGNDIMVVKEWIAEMKGLIKNGN